MKRNPALLRALLLDIEAGEACTLPRSNALRAGASEIEYHIRLLIDGGLLLDGSYVETAGCEMVPINPLLSWEGCEYLARGWKANNFEDAT